LAGQDADSKPEASFSGILNGQTAKTFDLINSYVEKNPKADDADQAWEWLFNTARDQGWESKTVELANRYLKQTGKTLPVKELAEEVRMLGLAKSGQWEDALLEWERHLSNVRLAIPSQNLKTSQLGSALAMQAQIAGKQQNASDIYKGLSRALFLNSGITEMCKAKLAKLELIGKPAPAVTVKDLAGQAINMADYRGKWVLLDFWATNCPPCIQELPALRKLYETYHARGLEVIGISLDEDPETVLAFQELRKLPWSMGLSSTDNGKTREAYHVPTIPAMYLVDPQGNIVLIDATLRAIEDILKSRLKANENVDP
jgi:peroxiredoxin